MMTKIFLPKYCAVKFQMPLSMRTKAFWRSMIFSPPVHILVIPKRPYIDMDDFAANGSPEEVGHFFQKVGEIARNQGLHEDGYRVVTNNGPNAGQLVPHFHVHIMGGQKIKEGSMARGMEAS
jgi:histidine triad (HIT) family protein